MSYTGKGDTPRPFVISDEEYEANLKRIFGDAEEKRRIQKQKDNAEFFAKLNAETKARLENNAGTDKNEFQDVLSTEDCLSEEKENENK